MLIIIITICYPGSKNAPLCSQYLNIFWGKQFLRFLFIVLAPKGTEWGINDPNDHIFPK